MRRRSVLTVIDAADEVTQDRTDDAVKALIAGALTRED